MHDLAAGLGENVLRVRIIAAAGAVLLCGATTAAAGPVGFVGLVVPHACRLLAGPAHRRLLPLSEWSDSSHGSVPIGHSVDATPLQMTAAYAAIANNGTYVQPYLPKPYPTGLAPGMLRP